MPHWEIRWFDIRRAGPAALLAFALLWPASQGRAQAPETAVGGASTAPAMPPGAGSGSSVPERAAVVVPVYRPPVRGAPAARIGGATRGPGAAEDLEVLAPVETGLTANPQPTLYWFNARQIQRPMQLTVMAEDQIFPLLRVNLPRPMPAGINRFHLTETPARLAPGTEYDWFVAVVMDPNRPSENIVASGAIRYVRPQDPVRVDARNPEVAAVAYAGSGFWYDAVDALAAAERHPGDQGLRVSLASLLDQVRLPSVAAFVRRSLR